MKSMMHKFGGANAFRPTHTRIIQYEESWIILLYKANWRPKDKDVWWCVFNRVVAKAKSSYRQNRAFVHEHFHRLCEPKFCEISIHKHWLRMKGQQY
jgi:hypothetical protein